MKVIPVVERGLGVLRPGIILQWRGLSDGLSARLVTNLSLFVVGLPKGTELFHLSLCRNTKTVFTRA